MLFDNIKDAFPSPLSTGNINNINITFNSKWISDFMQNLCQHYFGCLKNLRINKSLLNKS